MNIRELAEKCKIASRQIASLDTSTKNNILYQMAGNLKNDVDYIVGENAKDLKNAKEKGLSDAMVDRLVLNKERIHKMADALLDVASLPDPVGIINHVKTRPSGIQVGQMSIPLGVILMIYESRPNVTSDAAGLCLKAGNGIVLRGGSEAFNSNHAIAKSLHNALEKFGIAKEVVTVVPTTDRTVMNELLTLDESIDLVIPRGGEGLIRFVAETSRIPVIKHYKGVCHLYVDKDADIEIGLNMLIDGKTSRPGVCNALETMLVHKDIASEFLPKTLTAMKKYNVEMFGCKETCKVIDIPKATEDDFFAEYLSLKIAVKIVDDFDQAVQHIAHYGSEHTEVIATDNYHTAQKFMKTVNSSVVCVNASSRFSDGGELGLGAEIGISTTKLHAFGPMGLESLTTKKFIVMGEGQVRHPIKG